MWCSMKHTALPMIFEPGSKQALALAYDLQETWRIEGQVKRTIKKQINKNGPHSFNYSTRKWHGDKGEKEWL